MLVAPVRTQSASYPRDSWRGLQSTRRASTRSGCPLAMARALASAPALLSWCRTSCSHPFNVHWVHSATLSGKTPRPWADSLPTCRAGGQNHTHPHVPKLHIRVGAWSIAIEDPYHYHHQASEWCPCAGHSPHPKPAEGALTSSAKRARTCSSQHCSSWTSFESTARQAQKFC